MKIFQLFFLIFCIASGFVQAHAVITHSSLNVNSVITGQETQVELTFNSKIELNLSQIILVSSGDKTQLLEANPGTSPGFIYITLPPLATGDYAIQLKIFAADGHLSEELVRFTVTEITKVR